MKKSGKKKREVGHQSQNRRGTPMTTKSSLEDLAMEVEAKLFNSSFRKFNVQTVIEALQQAEERGIERSAVVAEDMTKEQEYKTMGHLCDNRCEWEREWTKKVVARAIRELTKKET